MRKLDFKVAEITKEQLRDKMKNYRNGQAEVLQEEQLEELFSVCSSKYKLLFAICYYMSYQISEALQLQRADLIGDRIAKR